MPERRHAPEMIALQSSLTMRADNEEAEILVYGVIVPSTAYERRMGLETDDKSASDFDKALKDAKASGAKNLSLRVNSPGGFVAQAMAMRTMLLGVPFDKTMITVDGISASAATLLSCIPNATVRMAEGSEFMIHNPLGGVYGTADDMESAVKRMRNLETSVRGIYANYTGKSEAQIKQWMDEETWFTAQEAVDAGFAHEVYKGMQAVACVTPDMMKAMRTLYEKVPQNVAEAESGPEPQLTVSNEPQPNAACGSPENTNSEEDTDPMADLNKDISTMTPEELRAANPALFDSVMQNGSAEERKRLEDIEALTPPGYEEMAAKAKKDGTSVMDYNKLVVKAQREKGAAFLQQRAAEVKPGASVPGAASESTDPASDAAMSDKAAADIARYAKQLNGVSEGGMF